MTTAPRLSSPMLFALPMSLALACAGPAGRDGAPCSVAQNPDGSATVRCPDGTVAQLPAGEDGEDADACRLVVEDDGTRALICSDGGRHVLEAGRRRHVILMIGDGMQLAHEVAASRYLRGSDHGLSFHGFPYQGFATTWDVTTYDARAQLLGVPAFSPSNFDPRVGFDPALGGERPYPLLADTAERVAYFFPTDASGAPVASATDSASAATAMATGVKTEGGRIAWGPGVDGGALESSAALLRRERGLAFGLVSTVPFSHATPAAFAAQSAWRGDYHEIAGQILAETRPEVVIGGGHPAFCSGSGGPCTTFMTTAQLEAARSSGEWIVAERRRDVPGGPALARAAADAIAGQKRLLGLFGGSGGSFAWGRPIHAPGQPRIEPRGFEDPTLAEAATAALEVLAQDPDGLFLLVEQGDIDWANHSNDFGHMLASVADLDRAVQAVSDFVDRPGDAIDWSNTTLIVTADHANGFMRFGAKATGLGELPGEPASDWVTWGSTSHTNELVSVYAKGAGSDHFWRHANVYAGRALVDDTAVFQVTLSAARGER